MKKLFLAFPILLLASCHSERVAFQFQPGPPAAGYVPRPAAAPAPNEQFAGHSIAPAASATPALATEWRRMPQRRREAKHQPAVPPVPVAAALAAAPAAAPRPLPQRLLKRLVRQHATAGPARTAESGLGGIGLFFIAVVLGLLAGLGALVSLIPGVSFLGGVGLAAAGLLVIFLLYSLLSGGKKKAKPAK